MLLVQEQVLVSGARDGTLQIRTNALDAVKAPQKALEFFIYDFYLGGMTCLAVHNGIVFTGGENGVLYACDCSEGGLKRAPAPKSMCTLVTLVLWLSLTSVQNAVREKRFKFFGAVVSWQNLVQRAVESLGVKAISERMHECFYLYLIPNLLFSQLNAFYMNEIPE